MAGEIAAVVTASSASDWRDWLARNGQAATEAWLVLHHRDGCTRGLRYHEAVEQALCFGWIDGLHRGSGPDSSLLRFTPRTARSRWSRVNRQRAARMTELEQMTEHGQAAIDRAKAAGTWQVLPDQQRLTVPRDLQALLDDDQAAQVNFARFPPSSRQLILVWIASAKRPATRQRRIQQTVTLAARDIRANHPRTTQPPHAADPGAASHRPFGALDTDNPGSGSPQPAGQLSPAAYRTAGTRAFFLIPALLSVMPGQNADCPGSHVLPRVPAGIPAAHLLRCYPRSASLPLDDSTCRLPRSSRREPLRSAIRVTSPRHYARKTARP